MLSLRLYSSAARLASFAARVSFCCSTFWASQNYQKEKNADDLYTPTISEPYSPNSTRLKHSARAASHLISFHITAPFYPQRKKPRQAAFLFYAWIALPDNLRRVLRPSGCSVGHGKLVYLGHRHVESDICHNSSCRRCNWCSSNGSLVFHQERCLTTRRCNDHTHRHRPVSASTSVRTQLYTKLERGSRSLSTFVTICIGDQLRVALDSWRRNLSYWLTCD